MVGSSLLPLGMVFSLESPLTFVVLFSFSVEMRVVRTFRLVVANVCLLVVDL